MCIFTALLVGVISLCHCSVLNVVSKRPQNITVLLTVNFLPLKIKCKGEEHKAADNMGSMASHCNSEDNDLLYSNVSSEGLC